MNLNTDDYELIRDFLSGNQQSFNSLAKRYQERIYWHARRMLGDHDDAHEIVQQVFMVMYNKLNTFNFSSSLYTWIYKVTSTRCLNLLKKKSLRKIFTFSTNESVANQSYDNIVEGIESKEMLVKMEKLLQKLPVKQREVFVMRNYDDLSYEEISDITGKTVGALKANYFHAFKKIREQMFKDEQ